MGPVLRFLLVLPFLIISATVQSQKPKTPVAKTPVLQKYKPPKLVAALGVRSDSATVFVEEAVQLIRLPLKITDEKKNAYTISSYQVMYKRKAVTENEETGKAIPIMSNVTDLFRETPLPELWKRIITEQLRPGEELFFFDIIAKDAQGRLMFAPDLKIKIK
jgi:hypothetical protein